MTKEATDTLAEKLEALPRYDGNGAARLGESVIVPASNGRYVLLESVRALLKVVPRYGARTWDEA